MSLFLRPQVTPFVILFVERSGSSYLASALASHPDIYALREQFAVLRQQGEGGPEQLAWAGEFLTPPLVGKHSAIGFKTKLVDVLDPDGFADLLRKKQCKIIRLQRKNCVKGVISTINAKRLYETSGYWNLLDQRNRQSPMLVDLQKFEQLLQLREQWDHDLASYVSQLSLPLLPLFYEDLLLDKSAFMNQVFSFLGVSPQRLESKTLKHTSDDLRQVVLNFDELRKRYAGTKYEAMFEEVLS